MSQYKYLLLDLDGTVTNPMEGITRSVQYALAHFGITVTDLESLCPFIGPPLKDSFREFYQFTDEQAETALQKYREYFSKKGLFENEPYEGIVEFLEEQVRLGRRVLLATSKPEPFAIQILEYFNLDHYFAFIGGSTLDGSRSTKADVIRYVLEANPVENLSEVVMIGDRKYDVIGAKENGLDAIGVLYGFGNETELRESGARYIAADLNELTGLLNR